MTGTLLDVDQDCGRSLKHKSITAHNCSATQGMAWTTPIDRVFNQKVFFYTFVGIIVGTTALTLFSNSPIGKTNARKKDVVFDPSSYGKITLERISRHRSSKLVHQRFEKVASAGPS